MDIEPDLDEIESSDTPTDQWNREMYLQSFSMLERESTLYWRRAYVFLIIHGALISIISVGRVRLIFLNVLSIFGIVFSLVWLSVLQRSQNYVYKWSEIINSFESDFDKPLESSPRYIFQRYNDVDNFDGGVYLPEVLKSRTSTSIQYVVVLIMSFWVLIFSYSLFMSIFR